MATATIVSISPAPIKNNNPSVIPSEFIIPACVDLAKPVFFHMEDVKTIYYIPLQERGKPRSRFEAIAAYDHAKSIVSDYCKQVVASGGGIHPGVIALEGKIGQFDKDFQNKILPSLIEVEKKWEERLIIQSDDVWNRYQQRKFISDIAVVVARRQGIDKEHEWARSFIKDARVTKECPACMSTIPAAAIVCKDCRTIIDPAEYNKKFKQAG